MKRCLMILAAVVAGISIAYGVEYANGYKTKLVTGQTIYCQTLILTDSKGNPRAEFHGADDGQVLLRIYKKGYNPTRDNATRSTRILLFVKKNNAAGIGVYNRNGRVRAGLFVDPRGNGTARSLDKNGNWAD